MSDSFKPTELNKLKYHQQSLENAVNSILLRLKNFPELVEIIEEFEASKTKSEAQTSNDLLATLVKIRAGIDSKKRLIQDKQALDSINDFKAFKKEMIDIQDQLQTFKIHVLNELMRLNDEIDDANEDVEYYSDRMVEWAENHRIQVLPNVEVPNTVKKIQNRHQCKEMRDFMDFVHRSNGHENGWRQDDHLLFLKMRKKYKDLDVLSLKLNELLPDIPVDEIKRHSEWYKQYLHLNKLKKAAVKTWQQSKQTKPPKTKLDKHEDFPKIMMTMPSMEDLHDRLNKWKEEKEARLMQNKQTQILREMHQKEREEQRKKRNEEMKKIVMEWKQTKDEMKEQQMMQEKEMEEKEKRRRASEANKLIKSFQTQDDSFVTRVLQQRKKKEVKLPVRSKSSQLASRDPERLLRPTKQWINRVHDDKSYGIMDGNGGKLPKLKVPEWRQQIS